MRKSLLVTVIFSLVVLAMGIPALAYQEAPMLRTKVAAGELPPVEQRLPEEPKVYEPVDEIGQYGGKLRSFMLGSADTPSPSNRGELWPGFVEPPLLNVQKLMDDPLYGWEPHIAKSWKFNDDCTEVTVKLRKGHKWSDGAPFTTEDIRFATEDIWFNKEFQASPHPWLIFKEEPFKFEFIDDVTFKIIFSSPYPLMWYNAYLFIVLELPKHYLSNFHPKYNAEATYKDLDKAMKLQNVDKPRIGAWMVEKWDATGVELVRNPYYFVVDTAGNQLPYIDRQSTPVVPDAQSVILKVVSGEIDVGIRNLQSLPDLTLFVEGQARGDYTILFWDEAYFTQGQLVAFNYDLEGDPEIRDLLRNKEFRNALSVAVDREDVKETIYSGLGQVASIALDSASPYWDEEMAKIVKINSQYDPERANRIFDELGLKDRDGDGMRELPSGKSWNFMVDACVDISMHAKVAEFIVKYWQKVGIPAKLYTASRAIVFGSRVKDRSYHVIATGSGGAIIPMTRWWTGVWCPDFTSGQAQVPDPPEDLKRVWELREKIMGSKSGTEIKSLLKELLRLRAENSIHVAWLSDIPIMVIRSNKIGNLPDKAHTLLGMKFIKWWQFYFKE